MSIAPLAWFRVLFGLIMLVEVGRYFLYDWVRQFYIAPKFHFAYFGFEWLKPWPGSGMYWHFAALGLLATCITAGFCYRIAAALFFLGFTYVFLLDEVLYLNHFYLVCLLSFLMIFLPAHRSMSLDATLRPAIRAQTIPGWPIWLLRIQLGIVYFYAGLAKLNADWLRGEPIRTWLARRDDLPFLGPAATSEVTVAFFTWGGLVLDLLIFPALLWRRTRVYAFVAATGFHVMNAAMFRIGIFPWLMLGATLLLFAPFGSPQAASTVTKSWLPAARLTRILAAVYLAVQFLFPLRHFLYPGNVSWTEEGHRFSWHMKLRSKVAKARYEVFDPESDESWEVDPRDYLEKWQIRKMPGQPDMVLQFAHYLADEFRRKGYRDVEVRADVRAALNGRRPRRLIDADVDLARVQRSLGHATWILPLYEPLRPAGSARPSEETGPEEAE